LLDLAGEAAPRGVVHARIAGRDLGETAIADPLRIHLPAELPLGRVPIDLELPDGVAVAQAGLSSALPAGRAWLESDDLLQTGDSLVELFTSIARPPTAEAAPATLVGQFVPPAAADAEARFELHAVDARGAEV